MFKTQTLKTSIVGTYNTLQAASKQVDLLFRSQQDVRVNIVPSASGFTVQMVQMVQMQ